jgi:toxin-antitoxin system PIN domain toxin
VILIDTNLLIYATAAELPQHERARSWLDLQLNGITGVGMPWSSLLGFVRLISNPRLFTRPVSVADAWGQVDRWLSLLPVWIPQPADRHGEILGRLISQAGRSDLVPDAHLAALALEFDLTLMTTDRDFARFDGLRWENPIASGHS